MGNIRRYENDRDYGMEDNEHGDYVLYADHKTIVENLKKAHEQELRNARERGYSDGRDSNYSWRV